MSVQVCPGCQGRNSPEAASCDWCGRPFDGRARVFSFRWWHLATVMLFGFVVIATGTLVYLSSSRLSSLSDFRPKPTTSPVPQIATTALPTRAATPGLTLATAKPIGSPAGTATQVPEPSPTSAPARYVRVVNTTGIGVFLREEPGQLSQRIVPAVAEGAVLRLVGPEQTVQAQIWRLCEHEGRDVQGWVLAQYLQSVETTPTPTRP
ncbi:MAG TPA: hypothetical protein VFH48_32750 [Chloroflexota bacterium]|nr:hypothetical protein [Chloroflexota bacterium]